MEWDAQTTAAGLVTDLNDAQRQAVTHAEGPLLILAGPGSGKTRVVTRRAAYLACTKTEPAHILAITFTNKAANEMRDRLDALGVADGMTACTFHALCAKLLRQYHDRAHVARNFTIFDRDDRRRLIKKAIEACDLSTTNWSPAVLDARIGRAKNDMMTPEAYEQEAVALGFREKTYARIYACYESLLAEMRGLDFDDLLMRTALLLANDSPLRDELEERYRYVLVDEYQDTNAAQYQIARLLTQRRKNLCATGDPDQSIYGWRGANIENILHFERDYPESRVVRLEQNYRSTKRILSAADRLISGNVERKEKTLWTEHDEGPVIRVLECEDGAEEAKRIAQAIEVQRQSGIRLSDMAIFYRVNSLTRHLEEALNRSGLPYQIARGVEFYNRKEIKDVLAYVRVLVNPADELALMRIINMPPRGIGATTIGRLTEQADRQGCSIHDLVTGGGDLSELGRSAVKVAEFSRLLEKLGPVLEQPATDALEYVISHSGLRAHYNELAETDETPIRNINELVSAASEYQVGQPQATIPQWLEHTALLGDVDVVKSESGAVTLMTLHAAKGLEFRVVYIIGLEDGLLPMWRNGECKDLEEERRLLFVGMTRAKERLTLSRARYRMMRGAIERTIQSAFLGELPVDEIEWEEMPTGSPSRRATPGAGRGRLPDDIEQWTVGTLVRNPVLGLGRVQAIRRGGRRTHVDVQFQQGLSQSWVLEFADLQRVDFDDVGDGDGFVGG